MAEAARVLEFPEDVVFGAAAPAREIYAQPGAGPVELPIPRELPEQGTRTRTRTGAEADKAHGISILTLFGSVFTAALMVFVVLAHVNYNEVTNETVRLRAQLEKLTEQESKLEIAYESVIDMKEVERYAKDVLGMSAPDAGQVSIIQSVSDDKVEIINDGSKGNALRGFGSFISSLLEGFRKG